MHNGSGASPALVGLLSSQQPPQHRAPQRVQRDPATAGPLHQRQPATRSSTPPTPDTTAAATASSPPPATANRASWRARASPIVASTSSHTYSNTRSVPAVAANSATAGQPPDEDSTATSTPRASANSGELRTRRTRDQPRRSAPTAGATRERRPAPERCTREAEHDVPVARQLGQQAGQHPGAIRTRRDLVDIVQHQAHAARSAQPHRRHHIVHRGAAVHDRAPPRILRATTPASASAGSHDNHTSRSSAAATRFRHRRHQQRRLTETRAGNHGHQPPLPSPPNRANNLARSTIPPGNAGGCNRNGPPTARRVLPLTTRSSGGLAGSHRSPLTFR